MTGSVIRDRRNAGIYIVLNINVKSIFYLYQDIDHPFFGSRFSNREDNHDA